MNNTKLIKRLQYLMEKSHLYADETSSTYDVLINGLNDIVDDLLEELE